MTSRNRARHHLWAYVRGFAYAPPSGLHLLSSQEDHSLSRVSPSVKRLRRYGNINPLPIDYAFQPRLRDRLTLGGFTVPRKP